MKKLLVLHPYPVLTENSFAFAIATKPLAKKHSSDANEQICKCQHITPDYHKQIRTKWKTLFNSVLSFRQINVPLSQLKLFIPMKKNKKIRNELLFALMVVALAALFAFSRMHVNKERQTAGTSTTELFSE